MHHWFVSRVFSLVRHAETHTALPVVQATAFQPLAVVLISVQISLRLGLVTPLGKDTRAAPFLYNHQYP